MVVDQMSTLALHALLSVEERTVTNIRFDKIEHLPSSFLSGPEIHWYRRRVLMWVRGPENMNGRPETDDWALKQDRPLRMDHLELWYQSFPDSRVWHRFCHCDLSS